MLQPGQIGGGGPGGRVFASWLLIAAKPTMRARQALGLMISLAPLIIPMVLSPSLAHLNDSARSSWLLAESFTF